MTGRTFGPSSRRHCSQLNVDAAYPRRLDKVQHEQAAQCGGAVFGLTGMSARWGEGVDGEEYGGLGEADIDRIVLLVFCVCSVRVAHGGWREGWCEFSDCETYI